MAGDMTKEEFLAECQRRRDNNLMLKGNTYPIKEDVKSAGGIWDKREKGWLMPSQAVLEDMQKLMGGDVQQDKAEDEPLTTDDMPF